MNNSSSASGSRKSNVAVRVWRFYAEGFRAMTLGRYLWALILVKLVIFFLLFKLFFFPDRLARDYDTDADRARAVRHELTQPRQAVKAQQPSSVTASPVSRNIINQ